MEIKKSKTSRRIGVVINFLCLILNVLLYEFVRLESFPQKYLFVRLAIIIIIFITHFTFFGKTGLWKFTHKSTKLLDEREIELSNRALRFSYSMFAVLLLSFLLILNQLNISINIVEIISFLYLAHILPAYFISWTEKPSISEE